jgi:hypothetical protein
MNWPFAPQWTATILDGTLTSSSQAMVDWLAPIRAASSTWDNPGPASACLEFLVQIA